MKKSFWSDAALFGAFLGLEEIVFMILETLKPSTLLGLLHFAAFIALLVIFTKRRAALAGSDEGYSYGKCWQYIVCMSLFAGVVAGAYSILAANFFFPEYYQSQLNQSLSILSQSGAYSAEMLREMKSLMTKMVVSPFWVMFSSLLAYAFKGAFCGLIVAAFTKREPQMFASDNDTAHE
ncbi:MAG: DUF4199 domain-containing protein [Alistipes sp.]|nr:DUF4199 domain-containing protein [Alistipes sp.]